MDCRRLLYRHAGGLVLGRSQVVGTYPSKRSADYHDLHPARWLLGGVLLSILSGVGLAVVFYLMPNTTGDILEQLVPFCVSFVVLLMFRASAVLG